MCYFLASFKRAINSLSFEQKLTLWYKFDGADANIVFLSRAINSELTDSKVKFVSLKIELTFLSYVFFVQVTTFRCFIPR